MKIHEALAKLGKGQHIKSSKAGMYKQDKDSLCYWLLERYAGKFGPSAELLRKIMEAKDWEISEQTDD